MGGKASAHLGAVRPRRRVNSAQLDALLSERFTGDASQCQQIRLGEPLQLTLRLCRLCVVISTV